MTIRFEARDLNPYAEPVVAAELLKGSVYFFVNFLDEDMLIPTMDALVYVGRNLEPEDVNRLYFQDVSSYRQGVHYATACERDNALFQSGAQNELKHVFDYEHALNLLLACALRRRGVGNSVL